MQYRVVFDIARQSYAAWPWAALGTLFVATGLAMLLIPGGQRLWRGRVSRRTHRVFAWTWLLLSLAWTGSVSLVKWQRYRQAAAELRQGRYQTVEGVVRDFVPMPRSGHIMESFAVGDRRFSYSDFVATPGFHQTAGYGGPIHEGVRVRVSYSGNVILRLEVAE